MIGLHALAAQAVGYGGARLLAVSLGMGAAAPARSGKIEAGRAALRPAAAELLRVAARTREQGGT